MAQRTEVLADWLRDAHAMERATIDNIERLVDRLRDHPDVVQRYREHLVASRRQLERIDLCLRTIGAEPSILKDTATRLMGILEAYLPSVSDDEAVKHCLAAYAWENFEIASYTALIAAADAGGHPVIKQACQQSLAEERAMADWLAQRLPQVTQQYLHRATAAMAGAA